VAETYRADHVGSLLRPEAVKRARADLQAGSISPERLSEVEDQAILDALERQRGIGLAVLSDGELRRTGFQNDLPESVEGFVSAERPAVMRMWQGPGGDPQEQGTSRVVGARLRQVRRLTEGQTAFLRDHAAGAYKMTVPTASQFPAISFQAGLTDRFYPTRSDLLSDLVHIIKAEIAALVDEAVPYIQIDAPRYCYYVDPRWRRHLEDLGEDPDRAFDESVAGDADCVEGVQREGLTLAMHLCRGNNQSKWYAQGGYDAIAEKLFGTLPVDRWLLEYDTDRAGSFEPLRFMPPGKMVVLGLISTKDPRLEPMDEILRRLEEAARYVPMEDLAISPQCGFASTAPGNLLTEDEQWRKLELVVEVARRAWG
jgi:5-methyltetrahydropteroyltriglutamate--homocysteine methyltransferase